MLEQGTDESLTWYGDRSKPGVSGSMERRKDADNIASPNILCMGERLRLKMKTQSLFQKSINLFEEDSGQFVHKLPGNYMNVII